MPPRARRDGARKGALSPELVAAFATERARLEAIEDDVERITAVGDAFAAFDREMEKVALVRSRAMRRLQRQGWSYAKFAEATGLSKGRVAQLLKDPRFR